MTTRPVPKRHWRSYGTEPLPTNGIDICRLNCVMVVLPGIIMAALRNDATDESNREDGP
jgi:hypothetical protein